MFKKILCMGIMAVSMLGAAAQTPLPLNPEVRHGKLANGLNYYILHNEEPKERVNFYIAQKVGSTLETPEQLGLAHFLEHMAFNGTKHYPGKNMLNYLQLKGIRFGADINAYTGFDETVYNINSVPSTDKALVDSVLLALYDWSGSILLEEDEINAERGVIESEWRDRNSATQRMYEAMLPQIYSEYQYQQMPIGKMEIVRNFPPQAIRDYYHKWYRPDQQGIVIVGDIDAAEMEEKVKKLFSDIPMPANAAERTYPTVSDNKEPIYVYFQDKELQYPMIMVMFKSEKLPWELRNTDMGYVNNVVQNLISMMINNRLQEYSQKPECHYAYAGVSFDDFLVSKTKDAFSITIIAKDDVKAAYNDAISIVARACKTGFTDSELVRARDEMLASYEKIYNERKNTKSDNLAQELIRSFIDNEPAPGIETEYAMVKQMLPMLPVAAYNEAVSQVLTPENQVIVVAQPEKEGMTVVNKEEIVGGLQNAINAQYEAYVDEVITDPLIPNLPKKGKITKTEQGAYESTVFTLSNGAKVIVKPTDFKADEIMMTAFKAGGKNCMQAEMAPEVLISSDIFSLSKVNDFNQVKLGKYLAGKNVGLDYSMNTTVTEVEGNSTVKDLPTFMELLYAKFTGLNPDQETYDAQMAQALSILKNADKNPNFVFQKHVSAASTGNNPLYAQVTAETIEKANYQKGLDLVKGSLANAADYTFVFTGNIDLDTFKPLMEQYIASLPSTGKAVAPKIISNEVHPTGIHNDDYKLEMATPSTNIYAMIWDKNVPYSSDNSVKVQLFGDILDDVFTQTLREEEGGAYSPYATASLNPYLGEWSLIYVVGTNDKMQEKIIKRANDEMLNLLKNGAKAEDFNKTREAMLKQYETNIRTNGYWMNSLLLKERGFDNVTGRKAAIENVTLESLNAFMKTLYNGKNEVKVIQTGVEAAK